ncbi:MAG: hypothetical protein PVF58_18400 [Candidatus Methanofastidiosia archaeon]|jgi:hypothetical protein
MEYLENETLKATCDSLMVTNLRIVEEKKTSGGKNIKEIPLNNINSIEYNCENRSFLVLFGILLFIIGLSLFFMNLDGVYFTIIVFFGILMIIIGALWKHEFVEFRATTLVMRGEGEGIEQFLKAVREQLYSSNISSQEVSFSRAHEQQGPRIISTDYLQ